MLKVGNFKMKKLYHFNRYKEAFDYIHSIHLIKAHRKLSAQKEVSLHIIKRYTKKCIRNIQLMVNY